MNEEIRGVYKYMVFNKCGSFAVDDNKIVYFNYMHPRGWSKIAVYNIGYNLLSKWLRKRYENR